MVFSCENLSIDILDVLWLPDWLEFHYLIMAPHSSTLAWKIPWTEEPGTLQSPICLKMVFEVPCFFWPISEHKYLFLVVLLLKSGSRNSKLGYVSRREKCQSHWEEDMRHCLLKSPSCAPQDNSCYQDGPSDGAYYEIGGTRTCGRGSWEESQMSWPLSLPPATGR